MQKLLGIIILLTSATVPVFALENYLILSDSPVVSIDNRASDVFTVKMLTTLMNERNTLVFQALREGEGEFIVKTEDGKTSKIKAIVKNDRTSFKGNSSLEYFMLDDIPDAYELDLPPEVRWNK